MLIPTKVLRDENSVDNKVKPEDQMSAAAIIKSRCSIITGILRSLILYLYQNNIDSDKVTDKINAVVNAFASTKDIPPYDLNWIRNTYLPSLSSMRCAIDSECPYVSISSKPYLYWYTIIGNILDDYSIFNYIYDTNSDTAPKFNDNEKALIQSYRAAQDAYFEARRKFEDYFRKVTITALRDLLLRHGTTLQQVAPEWYGYVSRSAGCFATESETDE